MRKSPLTPTQRDQFVTSARELAVKSDRAANAVEGEEPGEMAIALVAMAVEWQRFEDILMEMYKELV